MLSNTCDAKHRYEVAYRLILMLFFSNILLSYW